MPSERVRFAVLRVAGAGAPKQGWKLHVSATLLNANSVLERIGPLLQNHSVRFKAPTSLEEVKKLNSGVHYDYSQVGKLITVYPDSTDEARRLAQYLYELTRDLEAPSVPFDRRFRSDGCIYYRYGSFASLFLKAANGQEIPAILTPAGELVPDIRTSATACPAWVSDPFELDSASETELDSPLRTTYRAFRALSQRGKGGVYLAFDLSVDPTRLSILKEGRLNGEQAWDGRDGSRRIRNEEWVLRVLRRSGLDVPDVYHSFSVEENYYLVTEFIDGENLQTFLERRRRRLSIKQAVSLAAQIALLLSQIHEAGWTWRDCKPSNVLLTTTGNLRPIDFEGACPVNKPDRLPWGTQGFTPPVWHEDATSRLYEDLYGLGATLYFLLAGRPPEAKYQPLDRLRKNVPKVLSSLVYDLLSAEPTRHPTALVAAQKLVALRDHS